MGYPQMFDLEDNNIIYDPANLDEIFRILKTFANDKSPGPYGWKIEFFLFFFMSIWCKTWSVWFKRPG